MKKLTQLTEYLKQKVKNPTKRFVSITGITATVAIATTLLLIFLVGCEGGDRQPTGENPNVTETMTTVPETTTTSTTTASAQTTDPPETTEPATQSTQPPETQPINTDPVFQDLNEIMYSLGSPVNVRSSWSTSSEAVGQIAYGGDVKVTGYNADMGFYQVEYNGQTAYIVASFLSGTKPQAQQQLNPQPPTNPNPQPPNPPHQPVNSVIPDDATMCEVMNYANSKGFGMTAYRAVSSRDEEWPMFFSCSFSNSAHFVSLVFNLRSDGSYFFGEYAIADLVADIWLEEISLLYNFHDPTFPNGDIVLYSNGHWKTFFDRYA